MGHWGEKSYENDLADDALDAGFDRVHEARYEELMDDRNPLSHEQVQAKLANEATLAAALEALAEERGGDLDGYDDEARLAYAGIVVRHAELKVPIAPAARDRAAAWLESEEIEWDEATLRRLRREKEVALLRRAATTEAPPATS